MAKTYRVRDYDIEDDEDIVQDGDCLRVPMMMMDADQRAVHDHFSKQTVNDQQQFVRDELDALASLQGHRPGYCENMPSSRQTVKDTAYDLFERRGVWFQEAQRLRDEAYEDTQNRQQWKRDASQTLGTGYQQTLDPPYAMQNLSAQGNAMNRYRWTEEEQAVLRKAANLLGITVPEGSYAPWEDVHAKLIGLGPVGSENPDDPGSMSRTGAAAAVAARDAAFDALCKRSESAWKTCKAGAR